MQLDAIFYPCLTYNVDEGLGDNHYNCPVVAYYPEVLAGNCPELEGKKFIYDYVGIHRPKDFVHKMAKNVLPKYFGGISEKEVQEAADAAYAEYEAHMAKIRVKGSEIIDEARRQGKRIIVLAGMWTRRSTTGSTTSSPATARQWSPRTAFPTGWRNSPPAS